MQDDILDYTMANALLRDVFSKLNYPQWLSITAPDSPVTKIENSDIAVTRVRGADVSGLPGCGGLPVNPSTNYLLVRYGRPMTFSIAGVSVTISATKADDMCLLLDPCLQGCPGNGGVAFFLGLPDGVLSAFDTIPAISRARAAGLDIKSARLSVGGTFAAYPNGNPEFWNGMQVFTFSGETDYNFYVGGTLNLASSSHLVGTLTGDMYFNLPDFCGQWDNIFGTEPWGLAAHGKLHATYLMGFGGGLLGLRSQLVLNGDAQLLVSLGGTDRVVCGSGTDPSGLFLKIRAEAGVSILDNSLLGFIVSILRPSVSVDVDAFILVTQDTQLIPAYVKTELSEGIQNTVALLTQLLTWLMSVAEKSAAELLVELSDFMSDLNSLIADCRGIPSCWLANPELAAAANALFQVAETLNSLVSAISTLVAKAAAIAQTIASIIQQLQTNMQLAIDVCSCASC
jgi:hypothetical protein